MIWSFAKELAAWYRPFGHHDFWYVRCKLLSDPLYGAVYRELAESSHPVLDVGCGMGLLTFYLAKRGWESSILGVDYDEGKIAKARSVAAEQFPELPFRFEAINVGEALPDHLGDVTVLDVLQFFPKERQEELLRACAARVVPGGKLVIRTGLRDGSFRYRITRWVDGLANRVKWMKDAPVSYPEREWLMHVLRDVGFTGEIRSLSGRMPFNNWLATFSRAA